MHVELTLSLIFPAGISFSMRTTCDTLLGTVRAAVRRHHGGSIGRVMLFRGARSAASQLGDDDGLALFDAGVLGSADAVQPTPVALTYDYDEPVSRCALLRRHPDLSAYDLAGAQASAASDMRVTSLRSLHERQPG